MYAISSSIFSLAGAIILAAYKLHPNDFIINGAFVASPFFIAAITLLMYQVFHDQRNNDNRNR